MDPKFAAIFAKTSNTPTKSPLKSKPDVVIQCLAYACFQAEDKLKCAETGSFCVEALATGVFLTLSKTLVSQLNLKPGKITLHAGRGKTDLLLPNPKKVPLRMGDDFALVEVVASSNLRHLLVFAQVEYIKFESLVIPRGFVVQTAQRIAFRKLESLSRREDFAHFFQQAESSSQNQPLLQQRMAAATDTRAQATLRELPISNLSFFPRETTDKNTSKCRILAVRADSLLFSSCELTVKFENVAKVSMQRSTAKEGGTPVILVLRKALDEVQRIGFVIQGVAASETKQLKHHLNLPKAAYADDCVFDWKTNTFDFVPKLVEGQEEEMKEPLAPSDRPVFKAGSIHQQLAQPRSKTLGAPTVHRAGFALTSDGRKTFVQPSKAAPLPPLLPALATSTASKRSAQEQFASLPVRQYPPPTANVQVKTYASVVSNKRPLPESFRGLDASPPHRNDTASAEQPVDLVTPLRDSPRRSKRLNQGSASAARAEESKILFLYPSNREPSPQQEFDTITIRQADKNCLRPGVYLNDSIIDFCAKYYFREHALASPAIKRDVHVMSSFLFSRMDHKLCKTRGGGGMGQLFTSEKLAAQRYAAYSRVRYWSRGVDLFEKKYLVIPINKSVHWSVAIVHFAREERADVPPKVTVFTLDSLGRFHDPVYVTNVILLYLEHEWRSRALALEAGKPWPIPARSVTVTTDAADQEDVDSSDSDDCQIVEAPTHNGGGKNGSGGAAALRTRLDEDAFIVEDLVFTSKNGTNVPVRVPLQNDAVNCGIYALYNIEQFLENYEREIMHVVSGSSGKEALFEDDDMEEDADDASSNKRLPAFFQTVRFCNPNKMRANLIALLDQLTAAYAKG